VFAGGSPAVLNLLVPVDAAALARQVEEVPRGFERSDVARILTRIGRRKEHLRMKVIPIVRLPWCESTSMASNETPISKMP
jgi:hypothetical protein